jgi:hypothetical protein
MAKGRAAIQAFWQAGWLVELPPAVPGASFYGTIEDA